jgi:hypothetical protein
MNLPNLRILRRYIDLKGSLFEWGHNNGRKKVDFLVRFKVPIIVIMIASYTST